ncbi:helix-turn-helix transcriptional regulator [Homoserinimonas sp. OAct 916]|uniref:helix-turn-helix transcriptional regulator n=1 Tax=Homoserinimonas sp. OAct 916 TaxID=2211450 RepID=UPI0018E5769B|nr:helix-turn-helix transcriptional regulator [Homoserinimonas sp. OAct 916]
MTGRTGAARLTNAVERIAAAGVDDRDLRAQILNVIRNLIPFDNYAFLLTDPTTSVGCSPVADVPDLATLPSLIRLKYVTPVNRWTGLSESGCATLVHATAGRPEQSGLWREYLAGLGIIDVVSVVFNDRFGWWGFLDLWRRESLFTNDEATALACARPAITLLLRGMQAAAFRATELPPERRGPGALVLSPELTVRTQTAQTDNWLKALVPPPVGQSPIPASAYNVAAQLLAIEAGVDTHPAQARVHVGGGSWLTLRADRLGDSAPTELRDIVVTMESSSPTERRDVFSRSHGLTNRETEVFRHVADGADTRAVATLMSISELTVQDHLKAVFTKTLTSSRRELLALSLGR